MIDVASPQSPHLVGRVNTLGGAQGVAVSGTFAYVADGHAGFQVIDIGLPASPRIVGCITTGYAGGVAVLGDLAYVADEYLGLVVMPTGCDPLSDVGRDPWTVSTVRLKACPNPASGQTLIHFETRNGGLVHAAVYDPVGRRVRELSAGILGAGLHDLSWDGRGDDGRLVAAGVYWVRVTAAEGKGATNVITLR